MAEKHREMKALQEIVSAISPGLYIYPMAESNEIGLLWDSSEGRKDGAWQKKLAIALDVVDRYNERRK